MSYFGDENEGSESDNDNDNNDKDSDTSSVNIDGRGDEIDIDEVEDVEDVDADEIVDVDEVDDAEDVDVEDIEEFNKDDTELEEKEDEQDDNDDDDDTNDKNIKTVPTKNVYKKPVELFNEDDDEDDEDDDGEQYLQKFDQSINDNYILNFHPESVLQNYNEILSMTNVVRNSDGIIIDDLHRTIPYLTKYEKARILGQRAKQINSGHHTFVKVPENVIDGYIIAEMELKLKRIPFIIRRPLPNGGSEYWKIQDLENISF
jgi:DNA-directed RNA polymerase I, II, and III subunit RPABC2